MSVFDGGMPLLQTPAPRPSHRLCRNDDGSLRRCSDRPQSPGLLAFVTKGAWRKGRCLSWQRPVRDSQLVQTTGFWSVSRIRHCPRISPDNIRPPLLPPVLQEKALRSQIRIYAMPGIEGQPLPLWLFTRPAPGCRTPSRSPIRHLAPQHRVQRPVGFVVAFLRRARRSRVGAGWGSPRIISCAWRPVCTGNRGDHLRGCARMANGRAKPLRDETSQFDGCHRRLARPAKGRLSTLPLVSAKDTSPKAMVHSCPAHFQGYQRRSRAPPDAPAGAATHPRFTHIAL